MMPSELEIFRNIRIGVIPLTPGRPEEAWERYLRPFLPQTELLFADLKATG